jgi:ABC-2 type transport system permease protein
MTEATATAERERAPLHRPAGRLFLHQVRTEQLTFWRSRESAVFVFVFPLLLYVLLGAVYDNTIDGVPAADVLLAGMLGYGCANTAFAGLAITLVIRRESGVLKRLRATPLPAPTYLGAVLVSALATFALQTVALVVLGSVLYGASLPDRPFSLAGAVLVGTAGFAGLGLAAAALIRSAEGSSAVVNVIVLPMAFLSGAFGPTRDFPSWLQAIADVLPLKYFIEIVEGVLLLGEPVWADPVSLAVVAAWGTGGVIVARLRFGWEPRER